MGIPAGLEIETLLAVIYTRVDVQLGAIELAPLEPETLSVVVGGTEARNTSNNLEFLSGGRVKQKSCRR